MKPEQGRGCLANRKLFAVLVQKRNKVAIKAIDVANYSRYINSLPRMRRRERKKWE